MAKKRIAIDQDGVLADLVAEWVRRYNYDYDDNLTPEQITAWNWCHLTKPSCNKKIYSYMDDPELFASLPVIKDSQEVLQELTYTYDIYVVTAPFNINNVIPKDKWLKKHFPFLDPSKFVFTRDKSIIAAEYLIDDKPGNLETFAGNKILFDAPHNRNENGFYRVNNWLEVKDILLDWK